MSLNMPEIIDNAYVPTLNKKGYMTMELDPFSQAYVEYAKKHNAHCLEIGAAFGVATIPALEGNATVVANDIDPQHLAILKNRVPTAHRSRLELLAGKFPDEVNFPENTFDIILMSRVMHYFTPEEVVASAHKFFNMLKPNGKLFIVNETPYSAFLPNYIPIYEEKKAAGHPWPGYIHNLKDHLPPKWHKNNPEAIHLFDPDVLRRTFENAGFITEKCEFFARDNWPKEAQLDGRESVGLMARKPY